VNVVIYGCVCDDADVPMKAPKNQHEEPADE